MSRKNLPQKMAQEKTQLRSLLSDFRKAKHKCIALAHELKQDLTNRAGFDSIERETILKMDLLDLQGLVALKNTLAKSLSQLFDLESDFTIKKDRIEARKELGSCNLVEIRGLENNSVQGNNSVPSEEDKTQSSGQQLQGNTRMSNRTNIHQGNTRMSNRTNIHEGNTRMSNRTNIHEGNTRMSNRTNIHEGNTRMSNRTNIHEGNTRMSNRTNIHDGSIIRPKQKVKGQMQEQQQGFEQDQGHSRSNKQSAEGLWALEDYRSLKEQIERYRMREEEVENFIEKRVHRAMQQFYQRGEVIEDNARFQIFKILKQQSEEPSTYTHLYNGSPIVLSPKTLYSERKRRGFPVIPESESGEKQTDPEIAEMEAELGKQGYDIDEIVWKINSALENSQQKMRELRSQREKMRLEDGVWAEIGTEMEDI